MGRREGISDRDLHELELTLGSIMVELDLNASQYEDNNQEP